MPEPDASTDSLDSHAPLLTPRQAGVLCGSVLVVAACGLAYELSIATVSSYLLGHSVYQFSITIGLFMAAMGLGSYASRVLQRRHLIDAFVASEIVLALVGGLSTVLLFTVFPLAGGGLYRPIMVGLIAVIGGLVGLEIPIIVRALADHGGVRRGVADALSFDYVGALIGSLAFPIVLLPSLGLFRTAFAVGLTNTATAAVNLVAFGPAVRHRRLAWAALVVIAGSLATALAFHERLTRYSEGALYGGQRILHLEQTPFQRVVLTRDDRTGEHRLYLDGHVQFAEFDEYRYHEALAHPPLAVAGPRRRVLILGGGDGLAAREALRFPGVDEVTLVDLDPAITDLATAFVPLRRLNADSLADPRVAVLNADAFGFVRDRPADAPAFDVVLIDFPDPHNEAIAKLYSVEFFRMLRQVISETGVLSIQSGSPFFTTEAFHSVGATLRAAGFEARPYTVDVPAFGPWGFHLAGVGGEPRPESWFSGARFMNDTSWAAATALPPDISGTPDRAAVNSLFRPELYRLYRRGVERGHPPASRPGTGPL